LNRLKLKRAPSKGEINMADDAYDVVVAGYLKTDAATVDFDRLVKLEGQGYQNHPGCDPGGT
jgi:hypothetical protein